jgi:hypothetical protein
MRRVEGRLWSIGLPFILLGEECPGVALFTELCVVFLGLSPLTDLIVESIFDDCCDLLIDVRIIGVEGDGEVAGVAEHALNDGDDFPAGIGLGLIGEAQPAGRHGIVELGGFSQIIVGYGVEGGKFVDLGGLGGEGFHYFVPILAIVLTTSRPTRDVGCHSMTLTTVLPDAWQVCLACSVMVL